MATLYVENVPEDLYDALKDRAKEHRRSVAAEVITLLSETVPTEDQLRRRKQLLALARKLRSEQPAPKASARTVVHMLREDRER
ncbi:MAG: Arc family DNA-binding protein [Acidobacteriaceae bacterium]|nr:Arc family DNA-binding protein [Acidobacteriaceae bacterium]